MRNSNNSGNNYGFKKKEHKTFPPMIFAEITNVCNLRCIHCPHPKISRQKFYKPHYMSFAVYKKIVDEVSQYKRTIFRLVCDGEPMMHPNFLKMLAYAKQKGVYPVCFNTNGTLLDKKASLEILKYADAIEISLDAINENTYENIRKGANFYEVLSNVNRFIELKDILKAKTKIMVSIIDQPEVQDEIHDFVNYWTPRVDRVIVRTYTSIGGLINKNKLKLNNVTHKRWPCPLLWTRIFINVNGFIKFCVEDWLDKTILADIKHTSLKEAWRLSPYQRLRNFHLTNRFTELPYCSKCIDWPARSWDYDYFYALKKIL